MAVFYGGRNQLNDLDLLYGLFADCLLLFVVRLGGCLADGGDLRSLTVTDGLQALAFADTLQGLGYQYPRRRLGQLPFFPSAQSFRGSAVLEPRGW